jgi:DNA polymerase-3 subunit alpha
MYVSDHPLSPYAEMLRQNSDYTLGVFVDTTGDNEGMDDADGGGSIAQVKVPQNKNIQLAGMVRGLAPMISKKGDRMAKFRLEDMEGSIEAIIFPSNYTEYGRALEPDDEGHDAIVRVRCRYDSTDRGQQILVNEVHRLNLEAAPRRQRALELHISSERFNQQVSDSLSRTLMRHPGTIPVILFLTQSSGKKLRAELPTTVDSDSSELRTELETLLGTGSLRV